MSTDYWQRILKHMRNSILIMTPIYGLGILIWYLFFQELVEFKSVSIYVALVSTWIFVFVNKRYNLAHYNIPISSTDEYRLLIYNIDLYMVSIGIIVFILMRFNV